MLTRNLTNKIIDIRLEEEKFYFPGETIKGFVIVQPKSAIKVNSIQLKFYGEVYIHLKEKEVNTLFQKTVVLSVYPNSPSPKQTTLDASEHTFSFSFVVPKDLNLPSSMDFGKKAHIRYTINAILDRPMIPESLCPKVDYTVSLLEFIDIEKDQFKIPQEKSQDIMLPEAKYNQKCSLRASMPRLGFTRGDIVPLKVIVDHFTSYSRKNGVTIDLVRTVEIRTTKHTVFKETVLRSTQYDIHLKKHQQIIQSQLLIPTSTPPSIRYKDKVLRFHYKVRVALHLSDNNVYTLDMPIVIGTWPRAAVPIDDDDDSRQSQQYYEEDEEGDEDIESLRTSSIDDTSNILSSWHNSSTSTLTTAHRNSMISNNGDYLVGRSDSVASKDSMNSWKSLSRNTSQSTSVSSPDRLPSYNNNLTTTSSNRASSVYTAEYPYTTNNRHSYRQSVISLPNNRLSRYSRHEDENIVPTHILEPLPSSPSPPPPPPPEITTQSLSESDSSSSSSSLDSDDDDLLAIIERKKKKEKRQLRKQQQQQK